MECIFGHTYAAIEPTPPRDTAAQGASSVAAASRPGNRSRLTRRVTTVSYEAMYSTMYPPTLSSWLDCELPWWGLFQSKSFLLTPGSRGLAVSGKAHRQTVVSSKAGLTTTFLPEPNLAEPRRGSWSGSRPSYVADSKPQRAPSCGAEL